MKNLTDSILDNMGRLGFDEALTRGVLDVAERRKPTDPTREMAEYLWATTRHKYGFDERATPLLTPPDANLKLDKATVPSYGITVQHYVQKLSTGLTVNACPKAGDCTKVCVLDNGNGGYGSVQRARRAKTELLALYPSAFAYLLGRDLALAVKRDGAILLRPNVNSDVEWEVIAPQLCNGETPGLHGFVRLYGYTKMRKVLDTNGWLGKAYRVAFSANEDVRWYDQRVMRFLARGGSVAVVTNRKPHGDVRQWAGDLVPVLDADVSDEWIFHDEVIGDLSAKGKARGLIGKSNFINICY